MKTNHHGIRALFLATGFSAFGCNAGSDPELPVALEALNGPAVVSPCSKQRFATSHALSAGASKKEYAWEIEAPPNAEYDFEPQGGEFTFTARTAGQYRVNLTTCDIDGTQVQNCSSAEFPLVVTAGTDTDSNGICDQCEAKEVATGQSDADNCTQACEAEQRECGANPLAGCPDCGVCPDFYSCNTNNFKCEADCQPACTNRECGPDPACPIGTCGPGCSDGQSCNADGRCVAAQKAGRVLTIVLSLTNGRLALTDPFFRERSRLIKQSVMWVGQTDNPRVLVVQDDNHHGEAPWEPRLIQASLKRNDIAAEYLEEPTGGLRLDQLEGFDVVWFSNPGYPVDDQQSILVLKEFVRHGGGLVLQGDDITQGSHIESLSGLHYVGNGTHYCGRYINNDHGGNYEVRVESDDHPVIAGLQGNVYYYGDDIDSSALTADTKATVLAWAGLPRHQGGFFGGHGCGGTGCPKQPAIVAYDMDSP